MKRIKYLALSISLICWLACFLPTVQAQEERGINGESDTTVIGYVVYGDVRVETRYFFEAKDYQKAVYIIQLSQIPFNGLNVMAQKEYLDGLKYIKGMKSISQTKRGKKSR